MVVVVVAVVVLVVVVIVVVVTAALCNTLQTLTKLWQFCSLCNRHHGRSYCWRCHSRRRFRHLRGGSGNCIALQTLMTTTTNMNDHISFKFCKYFTTVSATMSATTLVPTTTTTTNHNRKNGITILLHMCMRTRACACAPLPCLLLRFVLHLLHCLLRRLLRRRRPNDHISFKFCKLFLLSCLPWQTW